MMNGGSHARPPQSPKVLLLASLQILYRGGNLGTSIALLSLPLSRFPLRRNIGNTIF